MGNSLAVLVFGAGVLGTVLAVRLARAGHDVTVVARGARASWLQQHEAVIEEVARKSRLVSELEVLEHLPAGLRADVCLITVRREQLEDAVRQVSAVTGIRRVVIMVNHAHGSQDVMTMIGPYRAVLAFPGFAGSLDEGIVRYVEVTEQPTAVQADASDITVLFRGAGLPTTPVRDMDAWLKRHAVFVTAVAGALYEVECSTRRLAADDALVTSTIVGIREGWAALDRQGVGPAPLALRAIFCWAPLPIARAYWSHFFGSWQADLYFARHAHHAAAEMAALAADLQGIGGVQPMPHLARLHAAIARAAGTPAGDA